MAQTRSRERRYLQCEGCGKKFDVPNYRVNAKFCSKACRSKKITRVCTTCRKEFLVKLDQTQHYNVRFCSNECKYAQFSIERKGSGTPWFKGGYTMRSGYRVISFEDGTRALEHRWAMEQHLGRKLTRKEEIHHRDGNKLNNDLSNLMVLSKSDHTKLHFELLEATGYWNGVPDAQI